MCSIVGDELKSIFSRDYGGNDELIDELNKIIRETEKGYYDKHQLNVNVYTYRDADELMGLCLL